MNEPVEVNIGACTCAHANGHVPHPDGDVVYMRAKPNLDMGIAAQTALRNSGRYVGDTHAALWTVFVRFGVTGWNLVDVKGAALPFSVEALLDRLEDPLESGMIVATRGVELYQDAVLAPLLPAKSVPPRPSRRTGSTSPSRASGRPTRRSPSPSSPSEQAAGT